MEAGPADTPTQEGRGSKELRQEDERPVWTSWTMPDLSHKVRGMASSLGLGLVNELLLKVVPVSERRFKIRGQGLTSDPDSGSALGSVPLPESSCPKVSSELGEQPETSQRPFWEVLWPEIKPEKGKHNCHAGL